ncbi:HK97 gp10 family phage protein [Streptomyces sp. NBC_00237]|uniref:HK97 gp10 family phage protein n=1 Tax=Streptomyces sp. NBC_00237 TaxID=2975687 RepID=UPI002256F528|nr:HK97 gp10 family phage protein [Streptomyces sp. NBC_00237]MCX5206750.1 HK97 gp10 family phage protein [Streptomyces sp. NBC_00237]
MNGGSFTSPGALAAALERGAQRSVVAAETVMQYSAQSLVQQVQQNASGHPGPRVITGRYRASWRSEVHRAGPVVVAEVGSAAPQARRLEFGFVGVDSLGRHYAQRPFPHLGPAVEQAGPALARTLGQAVEVVL